MRQLIISRRAYGGLLLLLLILILVATAEAFSVSSGCSYLDQIAAVATRASSTATAAPSYVPLASTLDSFYLESQTPPPPPMSQQHQHDLDDTVSNIRRKDDKAMMTALGPRNYWARRRLLVSPLNNKKNDNDDGNEAAASKLVKTRQKDHQQQQALGIMFSRQRRMQQHPLLDQRPKIATTLGTVDYLSVLSSSSSSHAALVGGIKSYMPCSATAGRRFRILRTQSFLDSLSRQPQQPQQQSSVITDSSSSSSNSSLLPMNLFPSNSIAAAKPFVQDDDDTSIMSARSQSVVATVDAEFRSRPLAAAAAAPLSIVLGSSAACRVESVNTTTLSSCHDGACVSSAAPLEKSVADLEEFRVTVRARESNAVVDNGTRTSLLSKSAKSFHGLESVAASIHDVDSWKPFRVCVRARSSKTMIIGASFTTISEAAESTIAGPQQEPLMDPPAAANVAQATLDNLQIFRVGLRVRGNARLGNVTELLEAESMSSMTLPAKSATSTSVGSVDTRVGLRPRFSKSAADLSGTLNPSPLPHEPISVVLPCLDALKPFKVGIRARVSQPDLVNLDEAIDSPPGSTTADCICDFQGSRVKFSSEAQLGNATGTALAELPGTTVSSPKTPLALRDFGVRVRITSRKRTVSANDTKFASLSALKEVMTKSTKASGADGNIDAENGAFKFAELSSAAGSLVEIDAALMPFKEFRTGCKLRKNDILTTRMAEPLTKMDSCRIQGIGTSCDDAALADSTDKKEPEKQAPITSPLIQSIIGDAWKENTGFEATAAVDVGNGADGSAGFAQQSSSPTMREATFSLESSWALFPSGPEVSNVVEAGRVEVTPRPKTMWSQDVVMTTSSSQECMQNQGGPGSLAKLNEDDSLVELSRWSNPLDAFTVDQNVLTKISTSAASIVRGTHRASFDDTYAQSSKGPHQPMAQDGRSSFVKRAAPVRDMPFAVDRIRLSTSPLMPAYVSDRESEATRLTRAPSLPARVDQQKRVAHDTNKAPAHFLKRVETAVAVKPDTSSGEDRVSQLEKRLKKLEQEKIDLARKLHEIDETRQLEISAKATAPSAATSEATLNPAAVINGKCVKMLVHGGSLKTWSYAHHSVKRIHIVLATEGRPLHADLSLWQGPENTPQKLRIYVENGLDRPFSTVIETPNCPNTISIRNTGHMELPLSAQVLAEDESGIDLMPSSRSCKLKSPPTTVQGGASRTFPFEQCVKSVQILLQSDGRPLHAQIEILQGPNSNKQLVEVYTEDGTTRPFFMVVETPGSGNAIRIVNAGTVEFPIVAHVEPYTTGISSFPTEPVIGGNW